ncbi:MAG: hypothetical protein KDA45_11150 [Planctomycetales bacterium]|nr:hypothetical protein [Planctomycetales bacterium]
MSTVIPCPKCGMEIQAETVACPRCNTRLQPSGGPQRSTAPAIPTLDENSGRVQSRDVLHPPPQARESA